MTLRGIDLIVITAIIVGSFAGCYALLLRKLHVMLEDRQSNLADQMGKLDRAIHALETRLAEHQPQAPQDYKEVQGPCEKRGRHLG